MSRVRTYTRLAPRPAGGSRSRVPVEEEVSLDDIPMVGIYARLRRLSRSWWSSGEAKKSYIAAGAVILAALIAAAAAIYKEVAGAPAIAQRLPTPQITIVVPGTPSVEAPAKCEHGSFSLIAVGRRTDAVRHDVVEGCFTITADGFIELRNPPSSLMGGARLQVCGGRDVVGLGPLDPVTDQACNAIARSLEAYAEQGKRGLEKLKPIIAVRAETSEDLTAFVRVLMPLLQTQTDLPWDIRVGLAKAKALADQWDKRDLFGPGDTRPAPGPFVRGPQAPGRDKHFGPPKSKADPVLEAAIGLLPFKARCAAEAVLGQADLRLNVTVTDRHAVSETILSQGPRVTSEWRTCVLNVLHAAELPEGPTRTVPVSIHAL